MENKKDIIIVGSGPIGIACALECKKRGWGYVVLEKGALTNSLFNYPKNMTFFQLRKNWRLTIFPLLARILNLTEIKL